MKNYKRHTAILLILLISLPLISGTLLAQCRGGGGGGVRVGSGRGGAPIGEEAESRRIHRNRLANLGMKILNGEFPLRPPVPELQRKQTGTLRRMSEKLPESVPERSLLVDLAGRLSSGHFKALAIYLDRKYSKPKEEPFKPRASEF